MLALLGRLVLGTGKFVAKNVLVPVALTAIAAAVLRNIADRIPEPETPEPTPRSATRRARAPSLETAVGPVGPEDMDLST